MHLNEFMGKLQPIFRQWTTLSQNEFTAILFQQFGKMSLVSWERICLRVLETVKVVPKVSHFVDARRWIADLEAKERSDTPAKAWSQAENHRWMLAEVNGGAFTDDTGFSADLPGLTPRAARSVLQASDRERIKYPQPILSALVLRAGEDGNTDTIRFFPDPKVISPEIAITEAVDAIPF